MKTKQFLSLLLMAALVLTLLPVTAFAATAQTTYVDENGNLQTVEATVLDSSSGGSILYGGWYVVNTNITIGQIWMEGAGLILSDDCELTVTGGAVFSNCTIYGQEKGTGRLTATGGENHAGITGDPTSSLTINGGTITATGGLGGAGIGGNLLSSGFKKVEINGGIVTATGGAGGAGIGGGYQGHSGNTESEYDDQVRINGGTVKAIAGKSFTGAMAAAGAGIGGGGNGGNGGQVYINGGSVYARAGSLSADNIGGGGNGTFRGMVIETRTSPAREVKEIPVILHGSAAGMRVDSITFNGLDYTYGIKDIRTGEGGKIYLYLDNSPIDITAVRILDEEGNQKTYTGTRYNVIGQITDTADLYPNIPPDITTTSPLPDGREGTSYNQQLVASARPTPTWSIISGSLPSGLTLSGNGVISGVPTENGGFNIQVKAVNTEGEDTQDLSLTIGESAGKYEITFYANNGTDTMTKQIGYKGEPEKLKQNTFTREGFLFDRWTTEPDGGGIAYDDQQTVVFVADTDLYAQWTKPTNTVTFNSNGGNTEPDPAAANVNYGQTAVLPTTNPTRGGFTFGGWNTEADGTGTDFTASTPVYRDVTVYAVWFENLTAGGGTETSPYLISTAEQLRSMAFFVNSDNAAYGDKYYRLTADINLGASWTTSDGADATLTSGRAWTAIGSVGPSPVPFTGSFDGGYHTINGLYHKDKDMWQGLFGYVQGATIENVGVVDSYIKCRSYAGGVVGYAHRTIDGRSTTIRNCYNTGTVSAEHHAGGVVGSLGYGAVIACYNTGRVMIGTDYSSAGGVVGELATGANQNQIKDCYNVGEISGGRNIGGICGYAYAGKISNCYNSGSVSGTSYELSAVGSVLGENSGILTNCVALGRSVSGNSDVGRVAGSGGGALTNNYAWDGMAVMVGGANKNPLDTGTDKLDGAGLLVEDGVLCTATDTAFDWEAQGFIADNGWELPMAKWKLPRLTALGGDFPDMPRKPDKTLVSVTTPAAITGVANGTTKTASALGLPAKVTLVTDGGDVQADVTWDVTSSSYDPDDTAEQTFTADGTVTLPSGVINPDSISLDVTISVTVNAAVSTDKTLVSITAPTAITGVANGTTKTASALGLPAKVTLVTDGGDVQADVTWDVTSSSYDPDDTAEQTFTADGTVTLPSGVINPDSISLDVTISVTVNAAVPTDKTLVSITAPTAITGVANGTTKTASALGLPAKVTLVTDDGSVQADVTWAVDGCAYDPDDTAGQTFTVDGTVTLPSGVINPDSISLDVTISVTVNAAVSTDKTLVSITAPTAITGVTNGTAKTASALGLPAKVTLVTDDGSVQADVTWAVDGCAYDPDDTAEQTFTADGTAALPSGVINPSSISLDVTISVTVNAAASTDKALVSITVPTTITGVANGTAKTAAALGLPSSITLVTDGGNVQANVTWAVYGCSYDPSVTTEQTFTVDGTVTLPDGVINPGSISLDVSISVTVNAAVSTDKTLVSITAPTAITGVANGTAKAASALGLPAKVTLVTNSGDVQADVTWNVDGCAYDPDDTAGQTFTVDGTAALPSGVINPSSISLDVTISVTVNAAASTDKTLVSITAPTAITGVANGTAKNAAALGLPSSITLVTDGGNVQANVTWAVYGCSYDPSVTTEQTFTVDGTVTLPDGVINPSSISLSTSITVTVNAATTTDKILVSVATPSAITGVANGTAKTASALGLPSTVTLVTNGGNVSASVSWDVASSSYNASSNSAQTFTVNGTVALPHGVINPDNIPLTISISVSVKKASSSGGGGGSGSSSNGTNVTILSDKRPDQPVIAGFSATPAVNSSGHATVTISQQSVEDAITKALADAKAQGKTANGIGISLNIDLPDKAKSLGIVLPQATLQSLVSAGVRQLEINGVIISLDLDLEALKEIQRQSTGDVTITIKPAQNLSAAAKKLIGARPVYDVSVSYVKDGKTVNITSLGKGSATLSLPYKPGKNEAVGWLFGVYVDGKGNGTRISGSAYDANSGSVILDSSHFSIYGVGYTAPTEKYTDITNHWAKESIDYVVGHGLFSGTTDTNFSPNTAMDRGMLVTVLGRLAGADVSAYKTSSFTDVAAGKYYLPYVEWAYKKGIISGNGDGKFALERAVTREEIALILQNYAKATGYTLPVTREAITFADNSSIGSSYRAAVRAMQQAGIMMGGLNNKFNPQAGATRAEVAAMLHRYVKLTIDPATAQGWAKNDDGRYLYYKDGKPLTGWQTIDGVKYYFNSTGVLQTGWVKDGSNWHYYPSNKALTGWWDIGSATYKKQYYFGKDGVMVSSKWLQINDKWYYFYTDGSLAKSTTIDGYEVDENGVRKSK